MWMWRVWWPYLQRRCQYFVRQYRLTSGLQDVGIQAGPRHFKTMHSSSDMSRCVIYYVPKSRYLGFYLVSSLLVDILSREELRIFHCNVSTCHWKEACSHCPGRYHSVYAGKTCVVNHHVSMLPLCVISDVPWLLVLVCPSLLWWQYQSSDDIPSIPIRCRVWN